MDKNLQNIEDLFRSSLEDNEDEMPTGNAWNLIEKRLDKENLAVLKRKNVKLKRFTLLLLIFLCAALYQLTSKLVTEKRVSGNTNIRTLANPHNETTKQSHRIDKTIDSDSVKSQRIIEEVNEPNKINGQSKVLAPAKTIIGADKNEQTTKLNRTKMVAKDILKNNKTIYSFDHKKTSGSDTQSRNEITDRLDNTKEVQSAVSAYKANTIENLPGLERLENALVERNYDRKRVKGRLPDSQQPLSAQIGYSNIHEKPGTKLPTKINRQKHRFSIMPFFSPEIASYKLSDDKIANQSQNARMLEKNERHLFSSTLGITVNYKINNHWGLYSGISLLHTNIALEPQMIYAKPDNMGNIKYRVNTSSGYGYLSPAFNPSPLNGDSIFIFNAAHKLKYISFPVGLTYSRTIKKINFNLQAGLAVNVLINAKLTTSIKSGQNNSHESINSLQGLKNGYLSGLAGIGIDYNLSDKVAIALNPVFRFAVSAINKDYTVTSFPKSLGFNLGIKFRL